MSSKQSSDADAADSIASESSVKARQTAAERNGKRPIASRATVVISTRLPSVLVEYDGADGTRVVQHFADAFAARRFYVRQDRLGNNPQVRKGQ